MMIDDTIRLSDDDDKDDDRQGEREKCSEEMRRVLRKATPLGNVGSLIDWPV